MKASCVDNILSGYVTSGSYIQGWLGGKPHRPLGLGNPPLGATNEKKKIIIYIETKLLLYIK
jgi:hypothetical protein